MLEAGVQQDAAESAEPAVAADIVLGILSYNSAETIGNVVRDAREYLTAFFPAMRVVIVNADGGSNDGTQERAASAAGQDDFVKITYPVSPAQKALRDYNGVPAKTNAVQAVFGATSELNAAACAVIDCNAGSPTGDWVNPLVRPVIENGIDFVSPCYLRTKYDGGILNGIIYPLTRALYGKRIHQPIGGEYALSGKLVRYLMARPKLADGETTNYSVDAWVTIQALCGDFLFAQASLGPRVFNPRESAVEVSTVLSQSLGAVFAEMNRTAPVWQRVRTSQPIQILGPHFEPLAEPAPVDPKPMVQAFRLGYENLQGIYRLVLPPATLVEVKRMSFYPADAFRFDNTLWARIIYDFALAWRTRIIDRDHLLLALTPLYLGWVASWVLAVRDLGADVVEDLIETLCLAYETQKGYLISRWRWPDRFNP
jgi:glycosyltransferase involved in cell wall biosynthesis